MKNSIITFVLFIIVITNLRAQQLPFSSQYYSNQFVTNPALTGNKGTTNAFLTHRTQWVGIAGSPQTSYFTLDGALKKDGVGLGMVMYSDVTDILSRTGANVNYSYKLNINTDNHLTFGLALGVINNKINFSKAVVLDYSDPYLKTQQLARTSLNADFGLAYNWKSLEVGFAVPQLAGNKINFTDNVGVTGSFNNSRHYYGSLKYLFDVLPAKGITAYPLIMVRSVAGAPFQYDINGVIDWKKYGWFGITYHSNYAIAFSAGARYKNLSVGLAYDFGTSAIKSYTGTTSEFLLSYNFGQGASAEINDLKSTVSKLEENDSINTIKINNLIKKDSLQDSLILRLKILSDSNKVEMNNIKENLNKLSSDSLSQSQLDQKSSLNSELARKKHIDDSLSIALKLAKNNVSSQFGKTSDFSSQGNSATSGYYVIIGAFNDQENAKTFVKLVKKKGYKSAEIIQNKNNKIYEVVVFKTKTRDEAIEKIDGIKSDFPDVWFLTLEK